MIKICTALGLVALAFGVFIPGEGLIDEPKPKPPILDVPTEIATKPSSDKCEWLGVCDA